MKQQHNIFISFPKTFLIICMLFFTFGVNIPKTRAATCTGVPSIGNATLSNCTLTIAGVTGADQANNIEVSNTNTAIVTLNSGASITINAGGTLAAGSIVLNGGSIAIASGSQLKPGTPLYVSDADGDGYATDFTVSTATSSGKRRLSLMRSSTLADCSASSFSENNTCNCWALSNVCDSGCIYSLQGLSCGNYFAQGASCSVVGTGTCYKAGGASAIRSCDDSMGETWGSYCGDIGYGCNYVNTSTACTWMGPTPTNTPTPTPSPTPAGCWAISNVCDSGCIYNSRYLSCGSYFTNGSACSQGSGTCYKSSGASAIAGCDDSVGWQGGSICSDIGWGCTYVNTSVTCTWKP